MEELDEVVSTIHVPYNITQDDILTVCCGFLPWESNGSGYWADFKVKKIPGSSYENITPSVAFAKGLINFKVYDTEDRDENWLLTRERLIEGIQLYVQKRNRGFAAENIDIDEADVILQYALMGEITYG